MIWQFVMKTVNLLICKLMHVIQLWIFFDVISKKGYRDFITQNQKTTISGN